MKILYKGYKVYIEYRCQNGHYSYEKIYDFYQRNKFNSINSVICSVGYEVNDGKQEFYYCNDCKKYFCQKDKIAHNENVGKSHNLINVNHIDNICNEHSSIINDYCLDCHKIICNKCISHSNHKKVSISKLIIKDSKLEEYRNKLNKLKIDYNNFYDECDKTIKEVLDFIECFNISLKRFKNVNDYSFNICEDLLNSYQYLKNKNCMIKLEYNTLFKLNTNFINFDYQITEEENKLIKNKNSIIKNNLEYKKIVDKNFESTYYGYFEYFPNEEREYKINGFGIQVKKNYKYIGEFKDGKHHGYGIYYFESGAYKFTKENQDIEEIFKLYTNFGQVEFCLYTKIIDKYQKYGIYRIERSNGTKEINLIKNNNLDDYGIRYDIKGELYEGYYLSVYSRHVMGF